MKKLITITLALMLFLVFTFTGCMSPHDPIGHKFTCAPDSDADMLLDAKEVEIGTDPFEPDSDGDNVSDGKEIYTYKTNPLDKNSRPTKEPIKREPNKQIERTR